MKIISSGRIRVRFRVAKQVQTELDLSRVKLQPLLGRATDAEIVEPQDALIPEGSW